MFVNSIVCNRVNNWVKKCSGLGMGVGWHHFHGTKLLSDGGVLVEGKGMQGFLWDEMWGCYGDRSFFFMVEMGNMTLLSSMASFGSQTMDSCKVSISGSTGKDNSLRC